jgi:hypothetical protein
MQQMTRKEYKAFMAKWRAVLANVSPPSNSWLREKDVQKEARGIAFNAVYNLIPDIFWDSQKELFKAYRPLTGEMLSTKVKMNHSSTCPNSYPHATRNP